MPFYQISQIMTLIDDKGQFGCVQPDAEQKGLRANKGKHRSHKTGQSARWPLPSKLANFICKGDHSPSGVTKTWKLWPKFCFTTETINLASHCPMSILLNRKLYEKKEGAHGRTLDKHCTVTTPPAQGARSTCSERSATCFEQMQLYAFYWRRPGSRHRHLKGPQTGLEVSSMVRERF